jgi:hypothetical protein
MNDILGHLGIANINCLNIVQKLKIAEIRPVSHGLKMMTSV